MDPTLANLECQDIDNIDRIITDICTVARRNWHRADRRGKQGVKYRWRIRKSSGQRINEARNTL